ncbi:transcriptional regulator, TetR family [Marinobacter daqiaonensis]|uniref:Transcriptional regulator, TetR family n=1 Tax=Marinobacter daqiaonensis TaxID=650891 RepID=A0A1I6IAZ1_9GAMM|nr:TetR/AcrR family transcriptional regulator [Marinobacter daqiaonensis]SFR63858.1 transcriptional regulator, TetR family [Marinobacter daqiaonensis]
MRRSSTHLTPRARPLKRPRQARARFTVQAIYDAYVRIWQRDGWEGLTTRKVALETGIAVGTLYDYFPSKEALHSGYVRHCIERLLEKVEQRVVAPESLDSRVRLHRLIRLLGGLDRDQPSWFHPDMMRLEPLVADRKYQQRAYGELLAMWRRVLAACTDLPRPATPETVEALHLAVWGGRRYALQVGLEEERMVRWAEETERMCLLMLGLTSVETPA